MPAAGVLTTNERYDTGSEKQGYCRVSSRQVYRHSMEELGQHESWFPVQTRDSLRGIMDR